MAEYPRDDVNAPQNPPNSVANPRVRRMALRAYLGPLVVFFVVVGIALLYWATRPGQPQVTASDAETDIPRAQGTGGDTTPGGHQPQPVPDSTRDEIEQRTGQVVTELGELLDEKARAEIGRRVEIDDVDVEQVETPTSFWVRDGNARVQVIAPTSDTTVRAGQQVNIAGVAERSGDTLRIRASKVTVSR